MRYEYAENLSLSHRMVAENDVELIELVNLGLLKVNTQVILSCSVSQFYLTTRGSYWLRKNVGRIHEDWRFVRSAHVDELSFNFSSKSAATLFKLTWG